MERYTEDFVRQLQEAADAAEVYWDPEWTTEEEIQQLYELWVESGLPLEEFVRRQL